MGTEMSTVLAQSREILKLFDDLQVVDSKEEVQEIVNSVVSGNDELRNNEIIMTVCLGIRRSEYET